MNGEQARHIAEAVARCLPQEYPHKLDHLMLGSEGAQTPRNLHPSFYGSYDWHSAVHCTWTLVRLYRCFDFGEEAEQILNEVLSADSLRGELAYLNHSGHKSFERPYGLAWLLKLYSELQEPGYPLAEQWRSNLVPLADAVEVRFLEYLRLFDYPVRVGTHSNSAFSMGLALEYARACGRRELSECIETRARQYFIHDHGYPSWMEPCGGDFLSPALVEADLMSRVLSPDEFVGWFDRFLGETDELLSLPTIGDRTDPSVIHLDGLCLSKAWCLERISQALPANHLRRVELREALARHASAGISRAVSGSFLGDHWLPSFATYFDSVAIGQTG